MTTRLRKVTAKTDPAIPGAPRGSIQVDVTALKRRLRGAVSGEVRFDPGTPASTPSSSVPAPPPIRAA